MVFGATGCFAGFGPTNDPAVSVAVAALACATALDAVKNDLNPRLQAAGMAPVQARAGADFGNTFFVRSGVTAASEVNVIGFADACFKLALGWFAVGFIATVCMIGLATWQSTGPS